MKAAEMFNLTGRVALVTGASSGLGQQFARALADNGAAVALVARRTDRLLDLQQEIEAAGGKAIAIEADVTDPVAVARLAALRSPVPPRPLYLRAPDAKLPGGRSLPE